MAFAGQLEARVELTLAAGSGLMGINAALQDRAVKDLTYAAILSVGEATPPQLRLLIRRLSRAFTVSIGLLVVRDSSDAPQIGQEPMGHGDVFGTSKALLDRIRVSAD